MRCKFCKLKIDKGTQVIVNMTPLHKGCKKKWIQKKRAEEKKRRIEKETRSSRSAKEKKPSWYRKKAIELAKKLAKERDGYTCQKCGKDRLTAQIQASHNVSVGQCVALAADVINILALCSYHHLRWWHSHPLDASAWFQEKYPDRYEYLMKKQKMHTKPNWEEIYKQLKEDEKNNVYNMQKNIQSEVDF